MAWLAYPTIMNVPTALGSVNLAFTDGSHVHVSTDAHINDDVPTVRYRGTDYLVSVHLYAEHGWGPNPDPSMAYQVHLKRRPQWDDASRTARAAIVEVLSSAVRQYVADHPDVLRQAEYADANNDADRTEGKITELAAELKTLRTELRKQRARQARNTPAVD